MAFGGREVESESSQLIIMQIYIRSDKLYRYFLLNRSDIRVLNSLLVVKGKSITLKIWTSLPFSHIIFFPFFQLFLPPCANRGYEQTILKSQWLKVLKRYFVSTSQSVAGYGH